MDSKLNMGRMTKRQKKIREGFTTLIFLICQEAEVWDETEFAPLHSTSKKYEGVVYEGQKIQQVMVEGQKESVGRIAKDMINELKQEDPADVLRAFHSIN